MNNERRRRLDYCNFSLSSVKAELSDIKESMLRLSNLKKDIDELSSDLADIQSRLDGVCDDEGGAYWSLPENFQGTNTAWDMWTALEQLKEAQKQFSSLFDNIDELESVYFSKFMATYNPTDVIAQIDVLSEAIAECQETIKEAK